MPLMKSIIKFKIKKIIAIETHAAVAHVPNLFGDEGIIIIGGGEYDYDGNLVEDQNENIVSFKIERTGDSSRPLAFTNKNERSWISNLAPYVQAIEDKIVIAQGGVVR